VVFNTLATLENTVDHKPAERAVFADIFPSANSKLALHFLPDPFLEIKPAAVITEFTSVPLG
jgi:hypothetical protein